MPIIIRTAEDMACAIANPPDPEIAALLQAHAERLAEYEGLDLSELGLFVIIQPGDTVEMIEESLNWSLLDQIGSFIQPIEIIARHGGYGLVLFVPIDEATEPRLLTACEGAFAEFADNSEP